MRLDTLRFFVAPLAACLALLAGCCPVEVVEVPAAEEGPRIGVPPTAVFAPQSLDQASTIRFDRVTVGDGLSQNVVLAIAQDWWGFMWFGTEDGLNKYDGYQFAVYKHDPADDATLSDNFISTIYEDRNGDLWIGTRNGLNRLDRSRMDGRSSSDRLRRDFADRQILGQATRQQIRRCRPRSGAGRKRAHISQAQKWPGHPAHLGG